MSTPHDADTIRQAVQERYGGVARRVLDAASRPGLIEIPVVTAAAAACAEGSGGGACCTPAAPPDSQISAVAAFYRDTDTSALPDSVTAAALGCGNPTALAELHPGETVLDLGSGGGIDCFLAARRVGPAGRVIGVDMTAEMLALARANAATIGVPNVEFRQGPIEALPVEDAAVDVIISNCVINLSADKDAVLREAFRVLRPGGRFRVSDIVLTRALTPDEAADLARWTGCIAGALHRDDFAARLRAAGFADVRVRLNPDAAWQDGACSADITATRPR